MYGTGFADIDTLLGGGISSSSTTLIAARPGMGQRTLAIQILQELLINTNINTLLMSLELSHPRILKELLELVTWNSGQHASSDSKDSSNIALDKDESTLPVNLDLLCPSQIEFDKVLEAIQGWAVKHRQGSLILIDSVEFANEHTDLESQAQTYKRFLRQVRSLVRESNSIILMTITLDRRVEKRTDMRPMLADLNYFDDMTQYIDNVIFLYKDWLYNPDTEFRDLAEVLIAKSSHMSGRAFLKASKGIFTDFTR